MSELKEDAQSLCKACGLCCDGTMFENTKLTCESDKKVFALEIFSGCRDQEVLPQPCPGLVGGGCVLYENRPRVCRAFKCGPLKKFLDGTVSYEETQLVIAEFRQGIDDKKKNMMSVANDPSSTLVERRSAEFAYYTVLFSLNKIFKGEKNPSKIQG